jgi:hypothetical protein
MFKYLGTILTYEKCIQVQLIVGGARGTRVTFSSEYLIFSSPFLKQGLKYAELQFYMWFRGKFSLSPERRSRGV